MAVALSPSTRDATVARVGRGAGDRPGPSVILGRSGILPTAPGPSMGTVGGRGLLTRRHMSSVLLETLVPRARRDVPLTALLVDIPAPGIARIRGKIRPAGGIGRTAWPLVAAFRGRDWRRMVFMFWHFFSFLEILSEHPWRMPGSAIRFLLLHAGLAEILQFG